MKNNVVGALVIIALGAVLTAGILVVRSNNLEVKVADLQKELAVAKSQKPETIIVTDTKVTTKYRDGKVVVQEKVPEGYVQFDMAKYESLMDEMANLELSIETVKSDLASAEADTVSKAKEIEVYRTQLKKLKGDWADLYIQINKPTFVTVQNKGWCFRPMIGVGYSGKPVPYVGVKYAFWHKIGFTVGSTSEQAGIGITRRMFDVVPVLRNTELMLNYGVPYEKGGSTIFLGLGIGI